MKKRNFTKTTRMDSLREAGSALYEGVSRAFKAAKEAIIRPKDLSTCITSQLMYSREIPEIDWFTKNEWQDFSGLTVDTAPYPSQEDFGKIIEDSKNAIAETITAKETYTKTYTSFSGCDFVAVTNGKVHGELQGIRYDLNENLEGNIDVAYTRFNHATPILSNALVVGTYANEYGQASYEIAHLDKMLHYKTSVSIDDVTSSVYLRYHGKLLQPMTVLPEEVKKMDDAAFEKMIERVRENCTHKELLNFAKKPVNNLANRTYIWVLDKYFSNKEG